MALPLGPTPLLALEAVAIDCETTGLDVRTARLVQLAGVAVRNGSLDEAEAFSILVDPGCAIPPAATAIHGIADRDVAGAATPIEALGRFLRFLDGRAVVGHAVAFDKAVLAAEWERAGREQVRMPSLCTRSLAEVVAPALPEFTLEALAAWLGTGIDGRHTAIGDARAAGRIFCALIPLLRARNIRTWGEAEAASQRLRQGAALSAVEGEALPRSREETGSGMSPAQRIDPFPYACRVSDLMTAPPQFLPDDASLLQAVRLMNERGISSVFVEGETGTGILTERDVLRALTADAKALDASIAAFASRPLQSVPADSLVYRAVGRMDRLNVRHLGVVENGSLVGALSARDLLRARASQQIRLDDAITVARDAAELAAAWAPLPTVAEALVAEGIDGVAVAAVISAEVAAVTRRACRLAEKALSTEGLSPPCRYALLVLGSAGRGESLLAMDQDNAIVFESGDAGGAEDRYFASLGARLADTLDAVGIPYCKGGVMAREEQWRGSLDTWRARIAGWMSRSRPEDLLSVDIFFDAEPVHGDLALAAATMNEARVEAGRAPGFIKLLAESGPQPQSAFGLFGGWRSDRGRVDLKRVGTLPIVQFARLLAMRHGVEERSTRGRLKALLDLKRGGETDIAALIPAFETILSTILKQQIADLHGGIPPSNRVEAERLPRGEQKRLRDALKAASAIGPLAQDMLF
jgi:CBS domain-containing protein